MKSYTATNQVEIRIKASGEEYACNLASIEERKPKCRKRRANA